MNASADIPAAIRSPIRQAAFSIPGAERRTNGDRYAVSGRLAVIADGISSSPRGTDAAEACMELMLEGWCDERTSADEIRQLLSRVNGGLMARAMTLPSNEKRRGGCCIAGVAFQPRSARAVLFHAGDAAVHRLGEGGLQRLTRAHRSGSINPRKRNRITSALGLLPTPNIEFREIEVPPSEMLIISTDGCEIDGYAEDIVSLCRRPVQEVAKALEHLVAATTPSDDATALVVQPESAG